MGVALAFSQRLFTEVCCTCGVVFAIPEEFQARLRESHKSFYCPSGHSQSYTGKTEAERLREKLENQTRVASAQASRAARAEQALQAAERATKRPRKRVAAGTCPCCKRTFKQLASHMSNKHPGYAEK